MGSHANAVLGPVRPALILLGQDRLQQLHLLHSERGGGLLARLWALAEALAAAHKARILGQPLFSLFSVYSFK